jgi:BspA type Leucine rich repeat region (6 copies)
MKTKIQILLIALALLLPPAAKAQFTYTINNGAIIITGYTGSGGAVVIPATTNGYPVVSIEADAFYDTSVTSVTIPDSVTSIGDYAFLDCTSLTNITVVAGNPAYSSANGVLFNHAETTLVQFPTGAGGNYTIPNSITSITEWAFDGCTGLMSVTIPDSVTSIGDYAFADCYGLTSLTIGSSVTSIGDATFYSCTGLTNVTIPNSVTSITEWAFGDCTGLTSVTIGNSVTSIGYATFYSCTGLMSVTIPDSVSSIGGHAFDSCSSLTSVTIPSSVTSIGDYAFNSCSGLTNITCLGNEPALGGGDVFDGVAVCATIYYYYGTSGWGTTYGGLPAVMLGAPAPQIGGSGGNVGAQAGQFGFTLTGVSNQTVVVEASTNLVNWQPVWTNTLSGMSANFTDAQWTNYPYRFYRARQSE